MATEVQPALSRWHYEQFQLARPRLERVAGMVRDGWMQSEIAVEMGVSRSRVAAMVRQARRWGLLGTKEES